MFETKLNPGILNRVLKGLTKAGIIKRCENEMGYDLTEKGLKISLYVFRIIEESGSEGLEAKDTIELISKRLESVKAA
jgi:predicted transcriptional regulator